MPQLVTAPWLFILLSSWVILLFFTTTKILKFTFLNEPSTLAFKNTNLNLNGTPNSCFSHS
uniref:ATP synthase complex subunit 8 n=1 Tax=Allobates aff. magnussoni AR-2020 TaxID=2772348 RepID=A0A7M3USJ3_9NEOB|nr:ATP synthase F0 subunit 8 [Allobates aff. magnussoni AR-2020]